MTEAQETAFRNPCLLAGETVHPRFGRAIGPAMTAVLTINTGYE